MPDGSGILSCSTSEPRNTRIAVCRRSLEPHVNSNAVHRMTVGCQERLTAAHAVPLPCADLQPGSRYQVEFVLSHVEILTEALHGETRQLAISPDFDPDYSGPRDSTWSRLDPRGTSSRVCARDAKRPGENGDEDCILCS